MADKPTPTFYLFYGQDDLAIEAAVAKVRAGMGDSAEADMNTSEFAGEETDVATVLNSACSFPFLFDKRLVIVHGLITHLTRKGAGESGKQGIQRLLDELPELPESARLVFVERGNLRKDSKLVKLAAEKGFCRAFDAPKDSTDWILQRAKREYAVEIERQAAAALASVTGNDLRRADNELIKLASYVDGERAISEHDVALLTPYVAEVNTFLIADSIATGDARAALQTLHTAMQLDGSGSGFRYLSSIATHFRRLLLVREALDEGEGEAAVMTIVRTNSSFRAGKFMQQARRFKLPQLERIYRRLQQYDQDVKTGRMDIEFALDMFIGSVAKK